MAITTSVTTTSSVSWSIRDTPVAANTTTYFDDKGSILLSKNYTDGSGAVGEVNTKWDNTFTLGSGLDTTLDVTALTSTVFGETITQTFTGIKDFLVKNNETGVNSRISILATGTNAFNNIFDGGSGNLIVHPSSAYHRIIWVSGINVSADNKNLIVRDVGGQGASVSVFLAGTSG